MSLVVADIRLCSGEYTISSQADHVVSPCYWHIEIMDQDGCNIALDTLVKREHEVIHNPAFHQPTTYYRAHLQNVIQTVLISLLRSHNDSHATITTA